MELINTKKMKDPQFCSLCEKDRKHVIVTYEDINDNEETYTYDVKKCKSCGNETSII